jgi:hypothetical protein
MNIHADYSPVSETELCAIMKAANANIANDHHNYTTLYDQVLQGCRTEPIRLLQLGMDASSGDLNTLAGWRTYFAHTDAFIAGVDRDISGSDLPIVAGAHTFSFSWSDPSGLDVFWQGLAEPFDIIIDGGKWNPADKAVLFANNVQHMKRGGVYIIQNINWRESVHWMHVKKRWDQQYPGIKFRFLSVPHPRNRENNIVILAQVEDATEHPYVPGPDPRAAAQAQAAAAEETAATEAAVPGTTETTIDTSAPVQNETVE